MGCECRFPTLVIIYFFFFSSKLSDNTEEGLRDLQQLLQVENINMAIRIGDIYSLLIEYHANRQRWKQAYAVLEEMRESIPETSIIYYVNQNLLMTIHQKLNIEYKMPSTKQADGYGSTAKQANSNDNDDDDIRDNVDFGTYDD